MTQNSPIYKNSSAQPLITTVCTGCHTPLLQVKFCNIIHPFNYPNSPTVPRYSVTCVVDPESNSEFLKGIRAIESREKVESIIKSETQKDEFERVPTGKLLIKFQGKDRIPVFLGTPEKHTSITLEDELSNDERVIVVYDILRYTKRNTTKIEHGISFKPTRVYLCEKE